MNFIIISHVIHKTHNGSLYAYAPYVLEMNLWLKYIDKVEIVAPLTNQVNLSPIDTPYQHDIININTIPQIQFTSIKTSMVSLFKLPTILHAIFKACKKADHIHLRCPGNIGLLGCLVQICFPKKQKTAKYAGNWDPKSKQPLSYRFQKWLLSNTFLTRNINVLVYGHWENQSKNIKPFFTATYYNSEIELPAKRDYSSMLNFVFVGSLVEGKQPLFAIQIIEALHKKGVKVSLDIFGEGILKEELQNYVIESKLDEIIKFKGNQSKENIKKTLKKAHFSILPSKSEGWPKAISEAMFFGVIPIATEVSCVPFMLDYGNRGILIIGDLNHDLSLIMSLLENREKLEIMSENASNWSQLYTLDRFESEIVKLLKH